MATSIAAAPYPRPGRSIQYWALWSLPPAAVGYVLIVDILGLATVLLPEAVTARQLFIGSLLTAICVLQHEATLGVERARRTASDVVPHAPAHLVPTSIYTMAAALALPPILFAAVTVVTYGHRWARIVRPRLDLGNGPGYRTTFNCTSILLAGTVVRTTSDAFGMNLSNGLPDADAVLALALVIGLYAIVQFSLVGAATSLSARSWAPGLMMLRSNNYHAQEFAQLVIGSLAAYLLVSPSPWLALLLLPTLWLFSRSVLVEQLRTAAATDSATGLLNGAAWHRRATQELARARRTGAGVGVLLIDLDAFRRINQTFGSRAGDAALTTIARVLPGAVRTDDAVGRLHGEEFAVIAPAADPRDLTALAKQIQQAVREADLNAALPDAIPDALPDGRASSTHGTDQSGPPRAGTDGAVTASVGIASWPDHANSLDELISVADRALTQAKKSGAEGIGQPGTPEGRR